MAYGLSEEVVLSKDITEGGLKKGDMATIVEHHPVAGGEDGYSRSPDLKVGVTFGIISENEVFEAVMSGKIIEDYPDDEPYPSCLIYGRTTKERPVHVVNAYAGDGDIAIVVTAYQPAANRWIDFERRRKV